VAQRYEKPDGLLADRHEYRDVLAVLELVLQHEREGAGQDVPQERLQIDLLGSDELALVAEEAVPALLEVLLLE
jgi:hypothetical protein